MKKIKNIFLFLFLSIQAIGWIFLHSQLVQKKIILAKNQEKISLVEKENENLHFEIAKNSSLLRIENEAKNLNLKQVAHTYVVSPEKFAYFPGQ